MTFPGSKIELDSRNDRYGNTFYVGRRQSPDVLQFKKGVAFFVFTAEEKAEELVYNCAKPGSQFDSIRKRLKDDNSVDRYVIKLERRKDEYGEDYFLGLVQDDTIELALEDGYVFFVFTSKEGKEELHITKNRDANLDERQMSGRQDPEIIHRRDAPRRPDSGQFKIDSPSSKNWLKSC